jgi:hypothetical protein
MTSSDGTAKTDFRDHAMPRLGKKKGLEIRVYGVKQGTERSNGFSCVAEGIDLSSVEPVLGRDIQGEQFGLKDIKSLGVKPIKECGKKGTIDYEGIVMGDGHITNESTASSVFHFPVFRRDELISSTSSKCIVDSPTAAPQEPKKKKKKTVKDEDPDPTTKGTKRKSTEEASTPRSKSPPTEPPDPIPLESPPEPPDSPDKVHHECGCADCVKEKCSCSHCTAHPYDLVFLNHVGSFPQRCI